jgi:alpha-glucosidase
MKYLKLMSLTMLILMTIPTWSQQNNSLGNLKKLSRDGQKIVLETDNGKATVTVLTDDIIRVKIAKQFQPDFSYAVVLQPVATTIDYTDSKEKLILKTATTVLEITKKPVRFCFKSVDGKIISQDDPAFGTSWNGTEVTTYKTLQPGEKFLGLGEKGGNLDRRGSSYVNWNTDNPHYEDYTDPIYSTIPFYMGMHSGLVYGILFDNTFRSYFNFGASQERFSSFAADDGEMDYYFINGKNTAEIIKNYTQLTGRMEMPPLWALGYQQCRWSYYPDKEVLTLAKTFRDKQIPADVLYLDIHHMDAYKVFTWNPERFSNPVEMNKTLKSMGFHTAVIVDPGVKIDKGYHAYEDGLKNDMFIKYPDGTPYTGQVWPGWCHFTDYTKPAARQWWGDLFKTQTDIGVDGFWNDMNEIATWGQATPSMVQFDWEGHKTTYREAKNVYGMLMARSTYEGAKKALNGKRPLIITRSGYAGLQRYTSIWTGDNQAHDDHMLLGVRLVNSLGLSGIAFTGYDIGGFGGDATPALFARWISLGAFCPFYRTHSSFNTKDSEPWAYGEDVEDISRNYINLHYRILPYIYSLFRESNLNGIPVQRSLAIDYASDERVFYFAYQNQYLFGPAFLVAPCKSTEMITKAYLPEGDWYYLYNDKKYAGNQEIMIESPLNRLPVFVKGSSIVPVQNVIQNTTENPGETLEIHVYNGKEKAEFRYYEDDGTTYDYQKDAYYERFITYNPRNQELTLSKKTGNTSCKFRNLRIVVHGMNSDENSATGSKAKTPSILPEGFNYQVINPVFNAQLADDEMTVKLK